MDTREFSFSYEEYASIDELAEADKLLLQKARDNTKNAYAPYSNFFVSAITALADGNVVASTNQENASYPVGICAERALLSTVSSLKPNAVINTIAIAYHNTNADTSSNQPVSPCGMCRQALKEYEERVKHPIRLILSGMEGHVFIVEKASQLLPLGFSSDNLFKL
jgi:cytidine deaminase